MKKGTADADPAVDDDEPDDGDDGGGGGHVAAGPQALDASSEPFGPPFLRQFPRTPELDALVTAFICGNYARVRADGPALAKGTEDDGVRAAARELVRRTQPDPLAKWFMIGAAGLLAFLALWFWSHGHGGL